MTFHVNHKYQEADMKHVFHERRLSELEKFSDDQLWRRFIKKDEDAFTFIYSKHVNALFNFGCQFISNKELVKDSIQDLFIRLRGSENSAEILSIKSYLYKCLYRDLIRKAKKEGKEFADNEVFSIDFVLPHEHNLINQQVSKDQLQVLKSSIKQLTHKQKQIILLFYYENLSYNEISEVLGMNNVKSARKLLYRALDKLKFLFKS